LKRDFLKNSRARFSVPLPKTKSYALAAALEAAGLETFLTLVGRCAEKAGAERLARSIGTSGHNLRHSFSMNGNPRFWTVAACLDALGFELTVRSGGHRGLRCKKRGRRI
jgi:probable addiction module antidote protein